MYSPSPLLFASAYLGLALDLPSCETRSSRTGSSLVLTFTLGRLRETALEPT